MDKEMKRNLVLFMLALVYCVGLMVYLVMDVPTDAELTVREYAQKEGLSLKEYPVSLVELLERNPETRDFVLNYPNREELDIDLSEYDLTQGVPLFMQWDPRWGYMEYGSGLVGETGCGPVCLAMAGYYVTGDPRFSPDNMVTFAADSGYYSRGNGSKWTLISEGGPALGLQVTELPLVEKKITGYLQAGMPIIAAMGPGDFTSSGHYIVLAGYEDGMLRINDPNSYVNSEKLWPYEVFADQVRNLWLIQAGETA